MGDPMSSPFALSNAPDPMHSRVAHEDGLLQTHQAHAFPGRP